MERTLSWQDVRDAPSLSNHNYRFVEISNRKYRKPPIWFSVKVNRIDGNSQQTTCHPGSIFEGTVNIKLETPIAAQYLKLVFKGAEKIHSDVIGKEHKRKGERLFAIRTVLWGIPDDNEIQTQWPIIEPGEHQFPFMCEMPMVNYPPTFRHHLASCEFELVACLERPGIRPFQTTPYYLRYEPFLSSSQSKQAALYQEKVRLSNAYKATISLPGGCQYNLLDTRSIPLELSIQHLLNKQQPSEVLNHIEVYVKRQVDVTHGTYFRSDTMVMSHVDQSTFRLKRTKAGTRTFAITLPLPTRINPDLDQTTQRNFEVLGMTTHIDFSKHIHMNYRLYVTAKVKHGLIWTKRQLFCIPLHFGTMSRGEQVPSSLVSYRDPVVTADTTLSTKPRFIRAPSLDEQLPAYDEETSPPVYQHTFGLFRLVST
ncbi:uncharacterized protein B0P05DRAFT_580936 [Gilbertella persicaria]|uniref:uncharacterized protein n=1 Tax=Gilbertella persicaria TaxID=101096 RepID=UPI00221E75A3|nr:uncharacterized protein B0P05DRAFT_580936 [Gilbertella persicaria]KAI8065398.1 hypothetical protein B0P05DRAFT_580936 [Gilbertella persicaria]